jgi:hypothetical protein
MEDYRIRQSHDKQERRADGRPNYSTDLSDAIDLIGHIGADGDGHVYSYNDGAVPE